MAPLPCSPVSNSTASEESQSVSASENSDDSLTTPRPGPADPTKRTATSLSTPSVPRFSSSPQAYRSSASTDLLASAERDVPSETHAEGLLRNPYTSGLAHSLPPDSGGSDSQPELSERRSVSFTPQTSLPKAARHSSYSSSLMSSGRSSVASNLHADTRNRLAKNTEDVAESSADENTAMMQKSGNGIPSYGAIAEDENDAASGGADGYEGAPEQPGGLKKRKSGTIKTKTGLKNARNANALANDPSRTQEDEDAMPENEGWFKNLVDKYGSVELENKGSVARDHLALERTFLAWLRTSLSFASIGIAVTQLFRLNTSLKPSTSHASDTLTTLDAPGGLRQVGKPLGATFLAISILILLLGFHRYFESQHYVIRGKFPASRGTIIIVTSVAFALIVTSLIVIVAIAPRNFITV